MMCSHCGNDHIGYCKAKWRALKADKAAYDIWYNRMKRERKVIPSPKIRETENWKAAAREARQGLMRAWDADEPLGPWVVKIHELLKMK